MKPYDFSVGQIKKFVTGNWDELQVGVLSLVVMISATSDISNTPKFPENPTRIVNCKTRLLGKVCQTHHALLHIKYDLRKV